MRGRLDEWCRRLFVSRAAVFLVGFGISFAVVVTARPYARISPVENHFDFGWEMGRLAASLAAGHGYSSPLPWPTGPTAWSPPVYPLLMALVFKLFGIYTTQSAFVLFFLNCSFTGLTAVVLREVGALVVNDFVGALAGWAWSLSPLSVYLDITRLWDTLLTPLLIACLFWTAFRLRSSSGDLSWLGLGAFGALTALTNSTAVLASLILWAWTGWRFFRHKKPWVRPVGLAVVGFLLLISPWWIRNYITFGKFIPLRSTFWMEVWAGNCYDAVIPGRGTEADYFASWEYSNPQVWINDRLFPVSQLPASQKKQFAEFARLGEIPYMAAKREAALSCLRADPGHFLTLTMRRFMSTWTGALYTVPDLANRSRWFLPVWIISYTTLSLLAFSGVVLLWRTDPERALPFAVLLCFSPAVYYITHLSIHYRYTIDPEIFLLASISLYRAIQTLWFPSRTV